MQRLGLRRSFNNATIHGIGRGFNNRCKGEVKLIISSSNLNKKIETRALCLSDLTQNLPGRKVQNKKLDYFHHLKLADENYEPLPIDVVTRWDELRSSINDISNIRIPRWIKYTRVDLLELHCFADASEVAYAAAVYVKVQHLDGLVSTNLIAAKSRVRLELCAAQLMTKLVMKVKETLDVEQLPIYGYSDSTIVLAWLSDHPRRWKTLIANRTSYILNVLPRENWRHISSHENPADLATRGITACDLKNSDLGWHGPDTLKTHNHWEEVVTEPPDGKHLEERHVVICLSSENPTDGLFESFSSYNKLLSVTTYLLRFVSNCKTNRENRKTGILSAQEVCMSHDVLVRKAQKESFDTEIQILVAGKVLPVKHNLFALTPQMVGNTAQLGKRDVTHSLMGAIFFLSFLI